MVLTKIDLLESIDANNQIMRLTFDDGKDSAFIIWNQSDLMTHLGEEVIATFRRDMYKGHIEKFVNTLAGVGVVRTLERDNNFKLYVDVVDNHSNILFREIPEGGTSTGAIVYVVDLKFGSSARADWMDLTVMDQARKIATLRIFSPDNKAVELKGRYIKCDIRRNEYGLSTDAVCTVDSSFPYNPEIDVCEKFIMDTFAEDKAMLRILADTKFTEFAKSVVDMEPGYILVRLAIELNLASEMGNLIKGVNVQLIKRCLLLEKSRIFQQTSPFREDIVTFVTASRYNFDGKGPVLLTLYSDLPEYKNERHLVSKIKDMADSIISVKKGLVE